ncbi:MAG: DMT family transporter [Hyphomicrobiaceae bacterium]|nr:DMT family transporter [Hyphomicrobiaceae bacterium]
MPIETPPTLSAPSPPPTVRSMGPQDVPTAIVLMLVAITLFSGLDAAAKYLAGPIGLPVTQIIWLRFLIQFLLLLLLVPAFGILSTRELFTTTRPGWQALRSVLMALTTAMNFLALKWLRLDQTIAITFLAPLIVALLAGPLLGEWVGWRRFAAIIVGFLGILIVVRPGVGDIHPAVVFSFAGVLAYALFTLVTRHIAASDPPLVTLFFSMFAGVIIGAPFALVDWQWPATAFEWALLMSLGVLGGIGHYLFILAYRMAPAGVITPYIYLQILTMTALGFLVFGDLPDLWTVLGSSIVVASGIYLWHRERMLNGR